MPVQPGEYELRYSFRDREVIHIVPITLTAAELDINAPDTAVAGSVVEIGWTGPNAQHDNIQIAPLGGGKHVGNVRTSTGNPVRLQMPAQPGDYELRYSFRDREILLTRPIRITAPE